MRTRAYLCFGIASLLFAFDSTAECISGATRSLETKVKPLGQKVTFYEHVQEEVVVGIDWAEAEAFKTKVRFSIYGKYVQYSADGLQRYEVTSYEAHPIATLVANIITLGIGILVNPKRQLENLIGCTDERALDVVPDLATAQRTGDVEWRRLAQHPLPQTIRVNTLTEFSVMPISDSDVIHIDLKESVMSGAIAEAGEIVLECPSCNAEQNRQYGSLPFTNSRLVFNADFRAMRTIELNRIKAEKEEEAKQAALLKKQKIDAALAKAKKGLTSKILQLFPNP